MGPPRVMLALTKIAKMSVQRAGVEKLLVQRAWEIERVASGGVRGGVESGETRSAAVMNAWRWIEGHCGERRARGVGWRESWCRKIDGRWLEGWGRKRTWPLLQTKGGE